MTEMMTVVEIVRMVTKSWVIVWKTKRKMMMSGDTATNPSKYLITIQSLHDDIPLLSVSPC